MSAYRGRTGPNYTEFLNNLNSASPLDDDPFSTEGLDIPDLEMFTNTNFTHHDMIPEESFTFDLNNNNNGNVKYEDLLSVEPSQQGFNQATVVNSPTDAQFYASYNTPIQPAPANGFPSLDSQSPIAHSSAGPRRKAEAAASPGLTADERSRVAAEEDKRRRNTAASARFRVKKKQREQALEKSMKEVNDNNVKLEAKVNQLEMENKWLKDLLTEKNAVKSREELESKYMEFKRSSEERETGHTEGVGTE